MALVPGVLSLLGLGIFGPGMANGANVLNSRSPGLLTPRYVALRSRAYSWKFDPYLCARAPYRLSLEDHIRLWSRIACPTLLVSGSESFLPDPAKAGVMKHFENAELARIEGAGHWIQRDKPDEVLDLLEKFFEHSESK